MMRSVWGKIPETEPSAAASSHWLPSRTGFNTRYLAGDSAGALGATALVPGELRAVLAPSRLLLLVHATPANLVHVERGRLT